MQIEGTDSEVTAAESVTPAETTSYETSAPAEASVESSSEQTKESLLEAVLKTTTVAEEPTLSGEKAEEPKPQENTPEEGDQDAEDDESSAETEASAAEDEVPESAPAPLKKKIRRLQRESQKLRGELETLRPNAEIGQQMQEYAAANNLTSQDVVFALDLTSMVARGDYAGFYKVISPLIRHAQEVVGEVLPPDLQSRVEQGQMTSEAARDFATTRFERTQYEQRMREMQQRQESQHVHQTRDDVARSVSAYEQRLAAQDPDYKAKAEMVRLYADNMIKQRGGVINSRDEALSIAQEAYNQANNYFKRIQPTSRPTATTPGDSNPQTPAARSAPKNLMEAVLSGIEKSRRAV